ncbi:MAG: uroporphyrinogen decarboxylase family protein [Candidatus Aminicenantaceae bacterium]
MTRYERLDAAWNLEEADRVPVSPLNCYILAYQGGISIKDMFTQPEKLIQAVARAREKIGEGDQEDPNITTLDHLSLQPKSGWDQVTLDWRIEDYFPPKGNIPSFFEKCIIEDYDDIIERGFSTVLFNKKTSKNAFKRSIEDFLFYEFEYPKIYAKAWRKFVEEYEVPLLMGGRATIPFELVLYYRGFNQFAIDMYEQPDKVKEMCEWILEHEIINALKQAMTMGAGEVPGAEKIFFQAGIAGPPYVSPQVFEEFVWPTLKKGVDMIVNRGFKAHVHMDGDLTSLLSLLKNITNGLPKGKVLLDFEKTDMKKAKEILGDKACIFGNVPASLLCFGTPSEVEEFCKKLIKNCAEGGGFILSTECETPWNAKPENVRAIINSAIKFGQY